MNILVSACLLGVSCRYDGNSCEVEAVKELSKYCTLIPICPEQMGGLPTPRYPSEIVGDKVINQVGIDVTNEYVKGAHIALEYALLNDVKYALLKAKSPSCGSGQIYDGTFSKTLINGDGICAKLLKENGIEVYSEENINELLDIVLTNKNTSV